LSNANLQDSTGNKSWQQTKSENTRHVILDAAIQCLYDLGYNNTTTEKIPRQACWKPLQSPLMVVFHELRVASRTEASWHRATKKAS